MERGMSNGRKHEACSQKLNSDSEFYSTSFSQIIEKNNSPDPTEKLGLLLKERNILKEILINLLSASKKCNDIRGCLYPKFCSIHSLPVLSLTIQHQRKQLHRKL